MTSSISKHLTESHVTICFGDSSWEQQHVMPMSLRTLCWELAPLKHPTIQVTTSDTEGKICFKKNTQEIEHFTLLDQPTYSPSVMSVEATNSSVLNPGALVTCRLLDRPIRVVPEGSASESTAESDRRFAIKVSPPPEIQPLFSLSACRLRPPPRQPHRG
jgi:hypothetical protein